jgi:DNA-binding response OmpR family regulator
MAPGRKVLIVEDEADFRDLIGHVLEENGYRVSAAANGEDGLKLYEAGAPDLVLLDVHLPDMTGFEICRKIRDKGPRPDTPILICTVRSEVAPVAEGLGSGATDYVIKPFELSDLLRRVAAALGEKEG